jgi:ligand-binding sensor domain-containing protein/DNA-binding CsgD family transcriptional regulator
MQYIIEYQVNMMNAQKSGCMRCLLIILLLRVILVSENTFSQIKTVGIPFIRNYPRNVYNAGTQNWAITQDNRGIMYFGNNNGILEYDGNKWQIYEIPNHSIIRSLLCDKNGTLYAGAFNEFGYLYPDKRGLLQYHSLIPKVPQQYRLFDETWRMYKMEDGILLHSFYAIFYIKDTTVSVVKYNDFFGYSGAWNNTLYIHRPGKGLYAIDLHGKDSLVPHGDIFKNKTITVVLPWKNSVLVGTNNQGIYVSENNEFKGWDNPVNSFLKENEIFTGIALDNGLFAFGTVQNGLVIIDQEGNLIQHISKLKGLQNNTVLCLFSDRHNNMWLGLDNGIDYIKLNSPVTYISPSKEIGAGYVSLIHNGIFYMGTNQGLYYTEWDKLTRKSFEYPYFSKIPNTSGQVWNLQVFNDMLICGHNKGFFKIEGAKIHHITNWSGGWLCLQVPGRPNFFIGGTYRGLILMQKTGNTFKFVKSIAGFKESCREIEFDDEQSIWIGHGYKGIFRLHLNEKLDSVDQQICYTSKDGLPSDLQNSIFKVNNNILVATVSGIFEYNKTYNGFIPNDKYNALFGKKKVDRVFQDATGNIWYFQDNQLFVLRKSYNGAYVNESLPFSELKENFVIPYEHINFIDNHNIIISTQDGFLHFDPSFSQLSKPSFHVLIRFISTLKGDTIFGGNHRDEKGNSTINRPYFQIEYLPYSCNDLHFEFSATSFEYNENVEYAYYLEGYDKTWSAWAPVKTKEYTNLKEGSYIFHVKAKTPTDISTRETTFEFVINPPWFRSAFAVIVYVILILLTGYLSIRLIKKRIEKEKEILKQKQKEELERNQKIFENEKIQAEQEITHLKNEMLQIEIERNKTELESRTRELAAIAMQITYKNELLNQIKNKLTKVMQKISHEDSKNQITEMIRKLEEEHLHEDDWHLFEQHFDQVHENFLKRIKELRPDLTPKDLKMCAYLRMNLSSKEIAPLLNISVRGVEISRYRLRKKLKLDRDENLIEYLMKI